MRGIGIGQKIHVFIIPEVRELIQRELSSAALATSKKLASKNPEISSSGEIVTVKHVFEHEADVKPEESHVLEDVVAWLIINSLRSEQTQWTMLCIQNISNLYRKNAFKTLLNSVNDIFNVSKSAEAASSIPSGEGSTDAEQAMKLFIEPLTFDLESGVPDPAPFEVKLKAMLSENDKFLTPEQHKIGQRYVTQSILRCESMMPNSFF